ncbi:hypothetical protein F4604DRAFT_1924472 [Suillus subluteus]|nr:hypothetical protein F4604DRAFT_1924472 [Suillus subluteus]
MSTSTGLRVRTHSACPILQTGSYFVITACPPLGLIGVSPPHSLYSIPVRFPLQRTHPHNTLPRILIKMGRDLEMVLSESGASSVVNDMSSLKHSVHNKKGRDPEMVLAILPTSSTDYIMPSNHLMMLLPVSQHTAEVALPSQHTSMNPHNDAPYTQSQSSFRCRGHALTTRSQESSYSPCIPRLLLTMTALFYKTPSLNTCALDINDCLPFEVLHSPADFPVYYGLLYHPKCHPAVFETALRFCSWLYSALKSHVVSCGKCSPSAEVHSITSDGVMINIEIAGT